MVDTLTTDGGQIIEATTTSPATSCDLMLKPFMFELTPLDYPPAYPPDPPPSPLLLRSPNFSCPKEDILSSAFNMTLLGPDLSQPLCEVVDEFTSSTTDALSGAGQPMVLMPAADEQQMYPGGMLPEGGPAYGAYYSEFDDFGYQESHL